MFRSISLKYFTNKLDIYCTLLVFSLSEPKVFVWRLLVFLSGLFMPSSIYVILFIIFKKYYSALKIIYVFFYHRFFNKFYKKIAIKAQ